MFGKFKKMISLFVAATVIAGLLLPVYGENTGGNTDILQGGNSVAEEEDWVTFDPSKTSEWESTLEGDNYIISQYKGSASKLYIPGVVNNRNVILKQISSGSAAAGGGPQVISSSVKELKTDYGVTIVNPRSVFRGCSLEKVEFNGTIFAIDNTDTYNASAFYGHASIKEASFYDCEFSYDSVNPNFDNMFENCSKLETVSFNNISIVSSTSRAKINSFQNMFHGCQNLITVTLMGIDVSEAGGFGSMFESCEKLVRIYVDSDFAYDSNAYYDPAYNSNVFTGCNSLVGGNTTAYDGIHTDYEYLRIDKNGSPGYLTLAENPNEVVWDDFNINDWKDPELSGTDKRYIVYYNGTGTKLFIPYDEYESGTQYYINIGKVDGKSFEKPAFPNTVQAVKMGLKGGYAVEMRTPDLFKGSRVKYAEFNGVSFTNNGATTMSAMDMFKYDDHIEYVEFSGCRFQSFSDTGYDRFDEMFRGCTNLKTVVFNESSLDGIHSFKGMFMDCPNLEEVYLLGDGINSKIENADDLSDMFKNWSSLKHIHVDRDLSIISSQAVPI